MFKLFKLNDDKYLILLGKYEIEGTKAKITVELVKLGVPPDEIAYGFNALRFHDMAEYGINRNFIFSMNILPKSV